MVPYIRDEHAVEERERRRESREIAAVRWSVVGAVTGIIGAITGIAALVITATRP